MVKWMDNKNYLHCNQKDNYVGAGLLGPSGGVIPDTPPFTPLKRGESYHIWYLRTARRLNFNLAPKFCVWDFPIKSYDFLKKSCQKVKLKKALQKNISVPIGIDFSVLK
jgi:hypothetical protein